MVRWFPFVCVLLAGCSNKLSGSLEHGGEAFTPTSCENLARVSQRGVELIDARNHRVRIVERVDGSADAYWFEEAGGKGTKFSDCATLTIKDQSSTVNKMRNVMGKAKLDCRKGDNELTGTVTFENCH